MPAPDFDAVSAADFMLSILLLHCGPIVELTCLSPKSEMASRPPAIKSGLCRAAKDDMVSFACLTESFLASKGLMVFKRSL